ncbi:MAG TPA: type II toxin-antitoxin system HicB family antitoxin [Nostocaceae cyanobacterium]|nr:type II toxin-antitoxin system HicB family antitoxin [Nostocaceae cyanobacterium]
MNPTIKVSPKSTYDVSIENQPDGTYKATVLSLPDCHTSGNTEQEAIEKISQILKNRLATSKIVTLEIDNTQAENPWLKLAGKYKDDPQFEEMLKGIEEYRQELDAEMEKFYQQLETQGDAEISSDHLSGCDNVESMTTLPVNPTPASRHKTVNSQSREIQK